jgi:GNAT superfamily N-acetyltransferase
MLTTEFLSGNQFEEYGSWLKAQDPETISEYFGCALGPQAIDCLVEKFSQNDQQNHFLVAKIKHQWVGTIHIATHEKAIEFGVIVALLHRRQGIANVMMDQAITWARNRFYTDLYMHCIERNSVIKRLCHKHDLKVRNRMGDSEANMILQPRTPATFFKEQMIVGQRNWLAMFPLSQFGSSSKGTQHGLL